MAILVKEPKRFTYIHIPKTAGTSVTNALLSIGGELIGRKHSPRSVLKEDLGFVFTIVRNPWERIVSGWTHDKKASWRSKYPMLEKEFNDGIYEYLEVRKTLKHSQLNYINKDDMILRYENLNEDWHHLRNILFVEMPDLPRLEVGSHNHYRDYYNQKTRDYVYQKYKIEIDTLGYEF